MWWLRSSPVISFTQSYASTVNSQPHTHSPINTQCNGSDLIYYSLIFYDIQFKHIYTLKSKRTYWRGNKLKLLGIRSRYACFVCSECVCVFGSFQLNWHHQQTNSLSRSLSLCFSFDVLTFSFLLIRKRCRNGFKYFPKHRNNNHHSPFTSSFKQKFCSLPLNTSKIKEALCAFK